MIGRRLSHYRIVEPLAEGGMGVVYRAWDEHLERDVAVKLLPENTLADESLRKRFRREALSLSRLNHPHINSIYDFDRSGDVDFIVMELVSGETLEQRLARGPLPETEVRRIGSQIASALAAAHEQGIVHRDLKPANVILNAHNDAKVLDFGIAKRLPALGAGSATTALTEPRALVGTLPYMAPEQVLGQDVDHRSDLFALGAVLYEMATGVMPFRADTGMALANAIVNQSPEPLRSRVPELSASLESVILRCLQKAPRDRFASAGEVARALASTATLPMRHAHRRWMPALAWSGIAVAAIVFVLVDPLKLRERLQGGGTSQTLAVLPLQNLSGDPNQEFFAQGMTEELTTALSKISALTVIASGSARSAGESRLELPALARKLRVRMLVQGAVARSQERVRVNARLIEAPSGRLRWSNSYSRNLSDVLELQGELALAIADEIQVRLTAGEKSRMERVRRVDPQAHEQYLLGLHYLSRASAEEQQQAIEHFQRAADLDPRFAAPHAATASAYVRLSTWWLPPLVAMPKAREAAQRALALDPELAEAHANLGLLLSNHEWRYDDGIRELERAAALKPSSAETRFYLGYVLNEVGRFSESRRHFLRAIELDPLNSFYRWNATWPLFYSGRHAETIRELEALIRDDPRFSDAFTLLGETLEQMKDYPRALVHLRRARELGTHAWGFAAIGRVFALMGERDSAQTVIRMLEAATGGFGAYVSPYGTASIYAALGDKDRAFALLERAMADRSEDIILLGIDPRMAPLRSDPRYRELLSRLGLDSGQGDAARRASADASNEPWGHD